MKCPNCGEERKATDLECSKCHEKFTDSGGPIDFSEIFKIRDEEEYKNIEELFRSNRENLTESQSLEDFNTKEDLKDSQISKDATQYYDSDEINQLLEESRKYESIEENKSRYSWKNFFKEDEKDFDDWFQSGDLFIEEKNKVKKNTPKKIHKDDYEDREIFYYGKKIQNIFLRILYVIRSFFYEMTNRLSMFVKNFLEKMMKPRSNLNILTKIIYFFLSLIPIFHYLYDIYFGKEITTIGFVFLLVLLTILSIIYRLVIFEGTSILIRPQLSSSSYRISKSLLGALGFAFFEFIFYFSKKELLFLSNALLTANILTTRPFSYLFICMILAYFNYLLYIRNTKKENRWKVLTYSFISIFVISLILNLIGITILQTPIKSIL